MPPAWLPLESVALLPLNVQFLIVKPALPKRPLFSIAPLLPAVLLTKVVFWAVAVVTPETPLGTPDSVLQATAPPESAEFPCMVHPLIATVACGVSAPFIGVLARQ